VKPGRAIDLRLVAETIDADVATATALNPSLAEDGDADDPSFCAAPAEGDSRNVFGGDRGYPGGQMGKLAAAPGGERGELTSIAKKYRVTPGRLRRPTDLEAGRGWKPEGS